MIARRLAWMGLIVCLGAKAQEYSEVDRSVRVAYSESKAITVHAVVGTPVLIELVGQEPVEDLVRGNPESETWEIAPRAHRVFVRALKGATPIPLTVATKSRAYLFDLVPIAATQDALAKRVGRLVVTSPPVVPVRPALDPSTTPRSPPAATDPQSAPRAAARRNHKYSLQVVSESIDVTPREVFDDGRFTYFRFPSNLEIPAIYRSQPDSKEEWLVNSHRQGDFVVMQAVAPLWTLRLAGTVLGIFNDAFEAEGNGTARSAAVPALRRELRQ
jgi:type IV secretion system protein VirB9